MIPLNRLSDVTPAFDTFVFDVWGVLHTGAAVFPEARDCLIKLKQEGKKVFLCSNAPRRAERVRDQLTHAGLPETCYDGIFTSGEDVFEHLVDPAGYAAKFGRTVYHIGAPEHGLWESTSLKQVSFIAAASFILLTGPRPGATNTTEYEETFEEAISLSLPAVCANPDKFVPTSNEKVWCAGLLGELYEKMGGAVFYHGKPLRNFFQACLSKAGATPDTTIIIGDSLSTDILGASKLNIKSLLVGGGLHKEDWQEEKGGTVAEKMQNFLAPIQHQPTYLIEMLR